jgi:hypothetical protein
MSADEKLPDDIRDRLLDLEQEREGDVGPISDAELDEVVGGSLGDYIFNDGPLIRKRPFGMGNP